MNDWGWRSSFYIWAMLSVAMVGVTYVYTRKTLKSVESSRKGFDLRGGFSTLLTRGFLLVVAMSTIVEMTFNIIVTYMPTYFTTQLGMSYSLSSTVSGLGPLMGLAGSFLGGFIGMRYGVRRMGILVLALIAVLLTVFPGVSALRTVLVAYGITRLLLSSYMPLMNSMIANNSHARAIFGVCFSPGGVPQLVPAGVILYQEGVTVSRSEGFCGSSEIDPVAGNSHAITKLVAGSSPSGVPQLAPISVVLDQEGIVSSCPE